MLLAYRYFRASVLIFLALCACVTICAQDVTSGPWVMQSSGTDASFRGIHAVGGGIVWASGTNGTVLRTEDSGYMWQSCSMPPGAKKLDFRGIWAWDENDAIVMSSGPGDQSRLYKTTDGCSHWTLLFTNPDKDGFYDALLFLDRKNGFVLGDPTKVGRYAPLGVKAGIISIRATSNGGLRWAPIVDANIYRVNPKPGTSLIPLPDEAFFAASNSSATIYGDWLWIGTSKARVMRKKICWNGAPMGFFPAGIIGGQTDSISGQYPITSWTDFESANAPLAHGNSAAGIFSLAFRDEQHGMAVGGDYQKPNDSTGTAAWTADGGQHWTAATRPPHGYRSAVAWDAEAKAWIAAGPNGSDISFDDGKTWTPLDNGNWNAISLPWIVGPKGRIAKLDEGRLKH
jgi:photosystem II stability/assembly factor-like uncharacterized protein